MNKESFDEKWEKELKQTFSNVGQELNLCLVAQGYEEIVFNRMAYLLGGYWTAAKIVRQIREEISR